MLELMVGETRFGIFEMHGSEQQASTAIIASDGQITYGELYEAILIRLKSSQRESTRNLAVPPANTIDGWVAWASVLFGTGLFRPDPSVGDDSEQQLVFAATRSGAAFANTFTPSQLLRQLNWLQSFCDVNSQSNVLVDCSNSGFAEIVLLGLMQGATLLPVSRLEPSDVHTFHAKNITHIGSVDTRFVRRVLQLPNSSIRLHQGRKLILSFGHRIYPDILRELQSRFSGIDIVLAYKAFDLPFTLALNTMANDDNREKFELCIKYPAKGAFATIVNDERTEVPDFVTGRLAVDYDCVKPLNDEARSHWFESLVFERNRKFFMTDTRASFRDDGAIVIHDDEAGSVRRGDTSVGLEDLELRLLLSKRVSDVSIRAVSQNGSTTLLVFVVLSSPQALEDVRSFVIKSLGGACHVEIVPVPDIPYRSDQLPDDSHLDLYLPAVAMSQPLSHQSEMLVSMFERVLKRKGISIDDDFFRLGGNSLKATQLFNQINQSFDSRLTLRNVFEYPTVRMLIQFIDEKRSVHQKSIPALPPQSHFVLSPAQKRMWILYQREEHSSYNVTSGFYVEGTLQVEILEDSFRQIIARHESLRTNFVLAGGELTQTIKPEAHKSFQLERIDLRGVQNAQEKVRTMASREGLQKFDIEHDLLFVAKLLQLSNQRYALIVNMPHIVADGWSGNVIKMELEELYSSACLGAKPQLPTLDFHYKDFASWQLTHLQGDEFEASRTFWKNKLTQNTISPIHIPSDYPRTTSDGNDGSVFQFEIDPILLEKVRLFSKNENLSVFVVLVTSLTIFLHKWSGKTNIVVATPFAGRSDASLENQIGLYVNTVMLANVVEHDTSIRHLLKSCRETVVSACEHQFYPFDSVLDEVRTGSQASEAPAFDIFISLDDTDNEESFSLPGVSVTSFSIAKETTQFELSFDFVEKQGRVVCNLEYATALYKAKRIQTMASQLQRLVDVIINSPDKTIDQISIWLPEQDRMIEIWSEVLNIRPFTVTPFSNWFDLSEGDLPMQKMLDRVASSFDCRVSDEMVLKFPTIEKLVAAITDKVTRTIPEEPVYTESRQNRQIRL